MLNISKAWQLPIASLCIIGGIFLTPFYQILLQPQNIGQIFIDNADLFWNNCLQALISSLISLVFGAILAKIIAEQRLDFLQPLLIIIYFCPSLIYVWGNISLFGTEIIGFHGVVISHIQMNIPIIAFVILTAYRIVPHKFYYISENQALTQWQKFCAIDWQIIKSIGAKASIIVFINCFTSFAVIITMGGGAVESLESAIYYALYAYNDNYLAWVLIAWQMLIILSIMAISRPASPSQYRQNDNLSPSKRHKLLTIGAFCIIIFCMYPIIFGISDFQWQLILKNYFWHSLSQTLILSMLVGLVSCGLILFINPFMGQFFMILPPISLSVLWVFWLGGLNYDASLASWLQIIGIQALIITPLNQRICHASLRKIRGMIADLGGFYGLTKWQIWRITWLYCQDSLIICFIVSMVFSMADYSVLAMLGSNELEPLISLLFSALASYKFQEASTLSWILIFMIILSFACMKIALLFSIKNRKFTDYHA